jgi:hypothetical protein
VQQQRIRERGAVAGVEHDRADGADDAERAPERRRGQHPRPVVAVVDDQPLRRLALAVPGVDVASRTGIGQRCPGAALAMAGEVRSDENWRCNAGSKY